MLSKFDEGVDDHTPTKELAQNIEHGRSVPGNLTSFGVAPCGPTMMYKSACVHFSMSET